MWHMMRKHQRALLAHWGRDKIATILQTAFTNSFREWKPLHFDWNFTKAVHDVQMKNNPALVSPSDTLFVDTYMRHSAQWIYIINLR